MQCVSPRALPLHLAVLAAKAWRRWREGTLLPFLRGRFRLVGEVPALLRHRRSLDGLGRAAPLGHWQVESRFWERAVAGRRQRVLP